MGVPVVLPLICLFSLVCSAYTAGKDPRNVCLRPWKLAFAHSATGDTWAGSKKDIQEAVIQGKDIKVTLLDTGLIYMMKVDNVYRRGGEVCAQSLSHLDNNGTHIASHRPKRYLMVCTNGYVNQLEESGNDTSRPQAMYWYSKDFSDSHSPVYSNYIDGSERVRGSLQTMWMAASSMAIRVVMRDRGYAFPATNMAVDPETGVVTAQSTKYIGQTVEGGQLKFKSDKPYSWFAAWSSNGHRYNARNKLHTPGDLVHNHDWVALDWFADTCWTTVFVNDKTGYGVFGSIEELIRMIRKGHRVKLTIDDVTFEATSIHVTGNSVAAQLLNNVARAGWYGPLKYDLKNETTHQWVLAHSSGIVWNYENPVGRPYKTESREEKRISWSVDTREWQVMLKTVDQGRPEVGNVNLLVDAIKQGATVRINVELDKEKQGDFFTEPENVRVDEDMNIVYAQAMNHISDERITNSTEYVLQGEAFYWYLMISSEGPVHMSAWYVGKDNVQRYEEIAPSADVTWFVNF